MSELYLTAQKIKQFTEIFMRFDYYSIGSIHYTSLRQIFRSMMIQITDQQIMSLLEDTGNKNVSMITLDQFLAIVSILVEDKQISQQIALIFKIFDTDKNKQINSQDIKRALQYLGLAYNQQEINDMLAKSKKTSLTLKEFQQFILDNK